MKKPVYDGASPRMEGVATTTSGTKIQPATARTSRSSVKAQQALARTSTHAPRGVRADPHGVLAPPTAPPRSNALQPSTCRLYGREQNL